MRAMSSPASLTVIVPMAGRGSRFATKGWTVAKPFIPLKGKMMVEWVLEGLGPLPASYLLIVREEFLISQKKELDRLSEKFSARIHSIPKVTLGAACTVLAARGNFNAEESIVVADSDTIYRQPVFLNFIANARAKELDASLLTMNADAPCYSYVKLDSTGLATEIAEKKVISHNAVCGAYYFKKAQVFIDHLVDMMIYGESFNSEYYMSQVCQKLICSDYKVGIFTAAPSQIICAGTPEQLNEALDVL